MTGIKITQKVADKIVFFEVSSPEYYEKKLRNPIWPELGSGITIGIGYDLGYCTVAQFQEAWGELLPAADFNILKAVIDLKGTAAQAKLASVKNISIPFQSAKKVFQKYSLPLAAIELYKFNPKVVYLFADAQGALLSLVYNRGSGTVDTPGSNRRKEMKAIQDLISKKDYDGISEQIISMKRLWAAGSGLLPRRDIEADLVMNSNRQYSEDELISL